MKYPIYVEYAFGYRKIEDEETYIAVNNDSWEAGIIRMKKAARVIKTILKGGNKVSEACFNNAFQNALTKLNEIASDQLGVEDWSTDAEKIEAQDRAREIQRGDEDILVM